MAVGVYDSAFYDANEHGSYRSAKVVLGLVFDRLKPESVVDFGCGIGTWLAAAREFGATNILGLDGDYVDPKRLRIDPGSFRPVDLADPGSIVAALGNRRFDMAICLEVAEHLPAGQARALVAAIASSADVVLWSAATPGQGGTCHINERSLVYWASLWRELGYDAVDVLRPGLQFTGIDVWYAQNAIFFVKPACRAKIGRRFESYYRKAFGFTPPLSFIHPASGVIGIAPDAVSDRLDQFATLFAHRFREHLGPGGAAVERYDVRAGEQLIWACFRQAKGAYVRPSLLLHAPYRTTIDLGIYYPSWQGDRSGERRLRKSARERGFAWNELSSFRIEGWSALTRSDALLRLSISMMDGAIEESAIDEAAVEAAALWRDLHEDIAVDRLD